MKKILLLLFIFTAFIASNLPAMSHCSFEGESCCCGPVKVVSQKSCCGEPEPLPIPSKQEQNDGCQCSFESGTDFPPIEELVLPSDPTALANMPSYQSAFVTPKRLLKPQFSRGPPGKQAPLYLIYQQFLL